MKNILNITVLFSLVFLMFSCRGNDVPEDIHEHEEIEKVTLTVTESGNTGNVQIISYIGGNADSPLMLENGKTYSVSIDFFHKHDGEYESMLDEIIEEKDQHFITYEFGGITANLMRTDGDVVRNDGKKLGLKTEWSITSAPVSAKVFIKLYHQSVAVDDHFPSASNQQGKVTGGEADADIKIDIQ